MTQLLECLVFVVCNWMIKFSSKYGSIVGCVIESWLPVDYFCPIFQTVCFIHFLRYEFHDKISPTQQSRVQYLVQSVGFMADVLL